MSTAMERLSRDRTTPHWLKQQKIITERNKEIRALKIKLKETMLALRELQRRYMNNGGRDK